MSASEKVARLGVVRIPGHLYYLRDGEVWCTPMKRAGAPATAGAQPQLVARADIAREPGYLYYLDQDGDIARTVKSSGSTRPAQSGALLAAHATQPALLAALAARSRLGDDGDGEPAAPFLAAASYLETLGDAVALARAGFIRKQCAGDSARELFEIYRDAWGIPRFNDELVEARDFRHGFLYTFRDCTFGQDAELARQWFHRSHEARFVRRYERWVEGAAGGEPRCAETHGGGYRAILEWRIAHGDFAALESPIFTGADLARHEAAIRRALEAHAAERLISLLAAAKR